MLMIITEMHMWQYHIHQMALLANAIYNLDKEKNTVMAKNIVRITESELQNVIKEAATNILKEYWDDDRFEYENFSDEGNGGIEEYGSNISELLNGLGDSDSLHAVGEYVAENMDSIEKLQWFIEGLQAGMSGGSNYDYYQQNGIERN